MNNLRPINTGRRNPLTYNPSRGRFLEDSLFFSGVGVAIALPEVIFSIVGGDPAAYVFIITTVIGIGWGAVRYHYFPFEIISCLSKEPVPKAPPGVAVKLKRAA